MRHDVRGVRKIAGVAMAVERRRDWVFRAAIPAVQQLAVVGLERQHLGAIGRNAVVLGIPTDDRLALGLEELRAPENAPADVEREENRAADQQRASSIRKLRSG